MSLEEQTQEEYDERFDEYDIANFLGRMNSNNPDHWSKDYSASNVNKFSEKFDGFNIIEIIDNEFSSDYVNRYSDFYNGLEATTLLAFKCSPEVANEFAKSKLINDPFNNLKFKEDIDDLEKEYYIRIYKNSAIGAHIIAEIYNIGVKPEEIPSDAKQFDLLINVAELLYDRYMDAVEYFDEVQETENNGEVNTKFLTPKNWTLIGSGKNSITLLSDVTLSKFGFSLWKEEELFYILGRNIIEEPRNVVYKYSSRNIDEDSDTLIQEIELEFVGNYALEQLVKKEKFLSYEKVLKYSSNILNGIWELRQAGIYHRDIHDRNIIINEEYDEAIIIDLGAATTNPNEVHEQNRLYGGNNDLISLGLLMYKMATGHNLFSDESGHSYREEIKDSIKTEREKTYEDPTLKKAMINKVRTEVEGGLGRIIMNLLDDDLWTQPNIEQVEQSKKMFQAYL
ncbi:MAG: hypothetical protein H8D38_04170 [DPANN group archaeon]|nr:hypothetical protein [DPANN group archaeon]